MAWSDDQSQLLQLNDWRDWPTGTSRNVRVGAKRSKASRLLMHSCGLWEVHTPPSVRSPPWSHPQPHAMVVWVESSTRTMHAATKGKARH